MQSRIVIDARDIQRSLAFYTDFFGFEVVSDDGDGIVELASPDGGPRVSTAGLKAARCCTSNVSRVSGVSQRSP